MDRKRIEQCFEEIAQTAKEGGYGLNADREFCLQLVEGILANEDRYGIQACPCRLFEGNKEDNLDIVCPCYYRADDLEDYGACYCALYITDSYDDQKQIPDRREEAKKNTLKKSEKMFAYPIWRCAVCGYLSANNNPPGKCPICKAGKERFEQFA